MSVIDPEGYAFIPADSSQAVAVLAAADAAGVEQNLIAFSPIRGGYIAPQAVADAFVAPAAPVEAPAEAPAEATAAKSSK